MNRTIAPRNAAVLSYAGLIPFIAPVILILFAGPTARPAALDAFLVYGAIILSFLGGIRWGAASSAKFKADSALVISVLPSLWAVACLLLPSDQVSAWGMMTGFVLMGLADWLYPGLHVASWMRPLRVRLTLAVVACHVVVIGLM